MFDCTSMDTVHSTKKNYILLTKAAYYTIQENFVTPATNVVFQGADLSHDQSFSLLPVVHQKEKAE